MSGSAIEKTYALFVSPATRKLAADLKSAGANVFEFPPMKTEKLVLDETATDALRNLEQFDWLILPDFLAADFFLEHLEESEIDLFELDFLRTCAVGEAVADRLRFVQMHADVIPATIDSEQVFSAVADYAGKDNLEKLKFLLPERISSKNNLTNELRNAGATVFELPVYAAKIINKLEIIRLKTLLENGAVDEFIFTAPADFIWLDYYFNNRNLNDVFAEIKISVTGGTTFQAARERQLEAVSLFRLEKIDKVNG